MKKTIISILILLVLSLIFYTSNVEQIFTFNQIKDTNIPNNSEQKENIKSFLFESEYITKDALFKKHNYLKLFDHSAYLNQTITVKQVNINPIEDKYMVFETEDGVELYLTNYSHPEYMFYGKYSLYYDMYDFTGYDVGDRFIIYYTEKIYDNIDMAQIGLITIIPEFQLIGSMAQGNEMGKKYISEKMTTLYNYFSETENQLFSCMSIEEAIANLISRENLDLNEFYKEYLNTGGYYYTNRVTSFTCIASFSTHSNSIDIHPTYAVYQFDGIPSPDNPPITYKLFIY